jgi:hypothetical protein
MPERHPVQANYRGKVYWGEWYVENAQVHLDCELGHSSCSVATGRSIQLPSEKAAQMLWKLARAADPKPPLFYWR